MPQCFNSLQTGKCIQSCWPLIVTAILCLWFQFPSNGKVYSEESMADVEHLRDNMEFQFPSNGKVYSEVL